MLKQLGQSIVIILIVVGLVWFVQRNKPEATGETMVEVELPHLTTTEEQGRALFVENCASCHGDNAGGRQGLAPPLVHIYYKQSHHADITFQLAAKNGVRQHHWDFGSMPPVEAVNEVDMKSIISFVRKLQEANGID